MALTEKARQSGTEQWMMSEGLDLRSIFFCVLRPGEAGSRGLRAKEPGPCACGANTRLPGGGAPLLLSQRPSWPHGKNCNAPPENKLTE
jgi:hypothetical protein